MKQEITPKFIGHMSILIALVGALSCQSAEKPKVVSSSKAAAKNSSVTKTTAVTESSKPVQPKKEQRKLVVYYLHGSFRCPSCNKIERLTKEAVEQGFADQIKKGRVELKVLNVEENGNEHFVEDYKLYTKSVILSDLKDSKEARWKNLDQVWTLLGNDGQFIEYIQKEVKTYLEG